MEDKNVLTEPLDCGKTCHKVEVPSEDEVTALDAMRTIKERVREIKRNISNLSAIGEDDTKRMELENEMARLRTEWKEWEEKREEAARIRMILLGHEEP